MITSAISDRLVGMLPGLSRVSGIVDEAVRMGQYPSSGLVQNVVDHAHTLQQVSIDLAESGQGQLARQLGDDAINLARKGGVMHAMNEHQNWFSYDWSGSLQGVVNHVQDAIRQLT